VEVHDSTGHTFRAKKVLLACSTPLYKKITFSPPLPEGKASLVESTKLGYYTKVLVAYDNPWWRDNGLSGASQSFLGPAAATRDTSEDSLSKFRLTSFIAGEPGRIWSKLPSDKRRMAVLNQLAAMFGSNAAMHVSGYIEMEWSSEEWSMGCPCPFTQPGVLTKVGCYLTEPFGQVHFIGAETASEWKGYMEGALASGSRGAYEVLSCLGQGRRNR
jgi:monoamine oxidase